MARSGQGRRAPPLTRRKPRRNTAQRSSARGRSHTRVSQSATQNVKARPWYDAQIPLAFSFGPGRVDDDRGAAESRSASAVIVTRAESIARALCKRHARCFVIVIDCSRAVMLAF